MHGQGVQQLVHVDDPVNVVGELRGGRRQARGVWTQRCRLRGAGGRAGLHEVEPRGGVEGGGLLGRGAQHVERELAVGGGDLHKVDAWLQGHVAPGCLEHLPHFGELAREQTAEERAHVHAGEEVAGPAGPVCGARVVAVFRVVERNRHELGHGDGAAVADALGDEQGSRHGRV